MDGSTQEAVDVLVVGGGVAGLEALFALREFAGERLRTTVLTPHPEFTLRPMRVTEPFGAPEPSRYSIPELAEAAGAEYVQDELRWLDSPGCLVHATNFPVKFGGIAAQQADVAAASIASLAGAPIEVAPLRPTVEALLIGGERALSLSAHITGGHGTTSSVRELTSWRPENKLAAHYLTPHLEWFERQRTSA